METLIVHVVQIFGNLTATPSTAGGASGTGDTSSARLTVVHRDLERISQAGHYRRIGACLLIWSTGGTVVLIFKAAKVPWPVTSPSSCSSSGGIVEVKVDCVPGISRHAHPLRQGCLRHGHGTGNG